MANNTRVVPFKNYVKAIIVCVVAVLLSIYIFEWYKVVQENKINSSYLIKNNILKNEIKTEEEIKAIFTETSDEYFIYVSYTGDENIYKMEKGLSSIIKKYKLQDKFYYINITEMKKNEDYLSTLNSNLNLKEQEIKNVPTILYFKNGEVVKNGVLKRVDNNIITADDFEQFLDEHEFES